MYECRKESIQAMGQMLAAPMLAAGVLLCAAGMLRDPARFGLDYLLGFAFVWSIVLGCLFWVALHHLTRAVWSVVILRVMEMLTGLMPFVAILFIPVALLAPKVYVWMDAAHVATDPLLASKGAYLNLPFFLARAVLFLALWVGFALYFTRLSLRMDRGAAGPNAPDRMRRAAALFMLLFALTGTFASFDWLMSLEPHWFSTVFGVYVFAGMMQASLAAIILLALWLRRVGALGDGLVRGDHLYSLGALLFAFSCFWGYIAMSQFLLIWYANLPEETYWYVKRMHGGWEWVSVLLMVLRFFLPFFALLSRPAKMNATRLTWVALAMLAGQLVELHWLIGPAAIGYDGGSAHGSSVPGPAAMGCVLALSGLALLAIARSAGRHPTVAIGNPLLERSRVFHL